MEHLKVCQQVGQLPQTNRAAAWVGFGKNISGRQIVHHNYKHKHWSLTRHLSTTTMKQ